MIRCGNFANNSKHIEQAGRPGRSVRLTTISSVRSNKSVPSRRRDRGGLRFREEGFAEPADSPRPRQFLVDIELWDFGRRQLRETKLAEIVSFLEAHGAEVFDRYVGPSITLVRASFTGALLTDDSDD